MRLPLSTYKKSELEILFVKGGEEKSEVVTDTFYFSLSIILILLAIIDISKSFIRMLAGASACPSSAMRSVRRAAR
jgi:hypothetical protein